MKKYLFLMLSVLVFGTANAQTSISVDAPNGGEVYVTGTQQYILWTDASLPQVTIEYSTNGGTSWNFITTATSFGGTGFYTWILPNVNSTNCLVKISNSAVPSIFDVSDAPFTIGSPYIEIYYPNGGEVLTVGDTSFIYWYAPGVNLVDIEYSINSGATYTAIAANIDASISGYDWVVPNTISATCLMRVKQSSNPSVNDISDNEFTIGSPYIDLYYPNYLEIFAIGVDAEISWNAPGITEVNIEYSIDGMLNWIPIVNNFSASTTYAWTVPNTPSTNCYVRVSSSVNSSVFDVSEYAFTIQAPSITATYPIGGETFLSGSQDWIDYDAVGVNYTNIDFSSDGGVTWQSVTTNYDTYTGGNSYMWNVPNSPSANCLLRFTDANNSNISDVTDFPFTIVLGGLPDCATNFYPPDGAVGLGLNPILNWNDAINITLITGYDIYFGTNSNPPLLAANQQVNESYTPPVLTNSTTYYWKVVAKSVNGDAVGCITNSFTTMAAGNYAMDNNSTETICGGNFYDAGGAQLQYNTFEDYTKTFYPSTAGQVLKFEFSSFETENNFDKLFIYNGINTNAPLIGVYSGVNSPGTFVATNPQGAITFHWISDYGVSLAGWEAAVSCVAVGTQSINLTAPNGGESWIANTTKQITWTSSNVALIKLEYSIDNGTNWLLIANNISNTGTYNWVVPMPASAQCLVKVSAANNSAIYDQSNANFEIQFVPTYVDVTSPNGTETFIIGTSRNITWQSMFVANVNIEYSLDAGTNWSTVISNLASADGSNSYTWIVPNSTSNLCLVRISDASNSNVFDVSLGAFYIVNPYLEIVGPNGGEVLSGATYSSISWSGFITTNNVTLEYSTNNGTTWNIIANSVSHTNNWTNYYNWFVPNVNSANCRVRVRQNLGAQVLDESNNTFTINSNTSNITIVQPNGGEVLAGGATYQIQWNNSFTSSHYKVQFSSNNGTSWSTLSNNVYNSGFYNWNVPNTAFAACLIRVSDAMDSTVFDQSDVSFSITQTTPFITIVNPNGGESLIVGSYAGITWNSALVNFVNVSFSQDGGTTYTTIISNLNNINYYNWLVPNSVASNCIIKVEATGTPSLFDKSNASFSIITGTPAVTLITPNGGENYLQNTPNNTIQWSGVGLGTAVKLEYSIDAGATWQTIINSFAAVNTVYQWFTPTTISSQCLIRISSVSNPSITDVSDAVFSINSSTPAITVTSPNGGEYLNQGYWYNITWQKNNVALVNVSYSDDNGTSWNPIVTAANASSYYWNVPNIASTQCLIKVEKAGSGAPLSDESNALFTIGPVLPNANTILIDSVSPMPFCKLDTFYVYYQASGVYNAGNSFDVQLSDSVGNFTNATLIGYINGTQLIGSIPCIVPTTVGNGLGYRVRVQSSDLPNTSPDNGVNIIVSSPQFDFAANDLIKYLPDGAVTFFVIPQQTATSTYAWTFGDGGTSSAAQPTHNYSNIGKYNVSCTIEDNGCAVTVDKPLYIRVEQLFPSYALNTNTVSDITSVSMLTPDIAVMTLKDGNCLKTFDGGTTWIPSVTGLVTGQDSLTACNLYPGKWRIVGTNGLIKESTDDGATWNQMTSPTAERMYGVASFDANNAFAVGDNGVILNYDGTNWVQQNVGVTNRFWSVAVDENQTNPTAYAVGGGGALYKFDGTNWDPQSSGISGGLFGTTVVGNGVVYAVGGVNQGLIIKTTNGGTNWNTVLNGVDVSFRSVSGIADTAWACAFDGIIYETRDGGSSWVRYSVGDTYNNNGINFKTSRGIVTGNGGHGRAFGLPSDTDTTALKNKFYAPNQLLIFPNPAQDRVTLKGQFEQSKQVNIIIKDIEGRSVMNLPLISLTAGKMQYSFTTNKLNSGVYFVFVDDGSNQFVKKLVITK